MAFNSTSKSSRKAKQMTAPPAEQQVVALPVSWADEMDEEDSRSISDSGSAGHSDAPSSQANPDLPEPEPTRGASLRAAEGTKDEGTASYTGAVLRVIQRSRLAPPSSHESNSSGPGTRRFNNCKYSAPSSSSSSSFTSIRVSHNRGWEALQEIWSITEQNLDAPVLHCLRKLSARQQEHILLSLCSIDLTRVRKLSAYLSRLIREHETTPQVCLYFLAGTCDCAECGFVHPVGTAGWQAMWDRWGLSYRDFDYTVLNFLCKLHPAVQDGLLMELSGMDVRSIYNLSAFLSSMIQKVLETDKDALAPPPQPPATPPTPPMVSPPPFLCFLDPTTSFFPPVSGFPFPLPFPCTYPFLA